MKILIIGIVASGKSTLARRLSQKTNIENYQIDLIVHDDENQIKRNDAEQQEIIRKTLEDQGYNIDDFEDYPETIYIDKPNLIALEYWGARENTQYLVKFEEIDNKFILKSFGMVDDIPADWDEII